MIPDDQKTPSRGSFAKWLGTRGNKLPFKKLRLFLKKQKSTNSCMFNALSNLYERSDYGYIIAAGAELAKRLGLTEISILELGVAGGRGLVAMEAIAKDAAAEFGIAITVYGFDTGIGMPIPKDSRDMPHFFKKGNYQMDIQALKLVLPDTEIVFGDVIDTFPRFLERDIAPIAAVAFDMDHYYSTIAALNAMACDKYLGKLLPRVFTYFDNTVGDHIKAYNDYAGEQAAIRVFNETHTNAKLTFHRHFWNLPINMAWHNKIYMFHLFSHPHYNNYIGDHTPDSLQLKTQSKQ